MSENILQGFKELISGTTLYNGKYTIEKKIGEGGFGITYKATQSSLGRTVCIKEYFPAGKCVRNTYSKTLLLQGFTTEQFERYRQAFIKEAKTLANLRHPNIVEVIDIFDENNTSYMVMPFIEGQSLHNVVKRRGKLPYPEAVNYIAQISDAAAYIHKRNILHRDIKPDNIIITPDFKAILIDFGSAREFVHDQTQAHTSVVSHGYAPTEQYTANSRKGSYTDIYAIGATFYFTLTGKTPLEAAARLTERMPEPKEFSPKIPHEANRTILKAMQLKAENRHQNVQDFMDDLRNIKPSILIDETIGGKKRKKTPVILISGIIIVALLLLSGGGYLLYQHNNTIHKQEIKEAKHDLTNGTVTNLKVLIYDEAIYLYPTEGILAHTAFYKVLNNAQLELSRSQPVNQSPIYAYTYSGQMKDGYPNDGNAIYDKIKSEIYNDMKPKYEGKFYKGIRHGFGKFFSPDGTIYEGEYENDMKKHGKETYKDESFYEGEWKNDKQHGEGYFKAASGEESRGFFDEGTWIKDINK